MYSSRELALRCALTGAHDPDVALEVNVLALEEYEPAGQSAHTAGSSAEGAEPEGQHTAAPTGEYVPLAHAGQLKYVPASGNAVLTEQFWHPKTNVGSFAAPVA